MNVKDHFCLSRHLLPAIASYQTQQNWKCLYIRYRNIQNFTLQIFGVVDNWERNPRIFSPLGFDVQANSDHKNQKIKLYSVRAFKRYLYEKNQTRGQVMGKISKFSPQILKRTLDIETSTVSTSWLNSNQSL